MRSIKKKSILGVNAKLHPKAKINNWQEKEKFKIRVYIHIPGELSEYPYGKGLEFGYNCYEGEYLVITRIKLRLDMMF